MLVSVIWKHVSVGGGLTYYDTLWRAEDSANSQSFTAILILLHDNMPQEF